MQRAVTHAGASGIQRAPPLLSPLSEGPNISTSFFYYFFQSASPPRRNAPGSSGARGILRNKRRRKWGSGSRKRRERERSSFLCVCVCVRVDSSVCMHGDEHKRLQSRSAGSRCALKESVCSLRRRIKDKLCIGSSSSSIIRPRHYDQPTVSRHFETQATKALT